MYLKKTVAAPIAALALVAAGCGSTIDHEDLETKLAEQLAPQAGAEVADVSVDCPEGQDVEKGAKFDCTLTAPNGDQVRVEVTLTDDEGAFEAVVPPQQFD